MNFKRQYNSNRGRATAMDVEIGKRLQMHRSLKGISQEALGDKLGKSFQQIQKYEKGINRISVSAMIVLADALEIDPAVFYTGLNSSTERPVLPVLSVLAVRTAICIDGMPVAIRKEFRNLAFSLSGAEPVDG